MNLYLDCEFNGFNGPLISLALVDELGQHFYEVLPCPDPIPWVAQNVMPRLNQSPITLNQFQQRLQAFLGKYEHIHVIADWPEDFSLFLNMLIMAPGSHMGIPTLTMQLWKPTSSQLIYHSTDLHNALSDAQTLALNYQYFLKNLTA